MEVKGIVRSQSGQPIEGALVMGLDLVWAETDAAGQFTLKRPEMALFFWCHGFYPAARALASAPELIEVTLRPCPVPKS